MIDDPQVQLIHDLLAFTDYRGLKELWGRRNTSSAAVNADALASDMAGMSISRIEVPLQALMEKLKYVGKELIVREWTFDGGDTVFRYTCSPQERQLVQRYVSDEIHTLLKAPTRAQQVDAPTRAQQKQETLLLGDAFKKLCQLLNEENLNDDDKTTVERYKKQIIEKTHEFDQTNGTQLAPYLRGALNMSASLPANVVVVTEKPMTLTRADAFSRRGSVVVTEKPMELLRTKAFSRSGSVGNARSSLG